MIDEAEDSVPNCESLANGGTGTGSGAKREDTETFAAADAFLTYMESKFGRADNRDLFSP